MPPRLYEIRVYRDGRESRLEPILAELDFNRHPEDVNRLLTRHVWAAAKRLGVRDRHVHEVELRVRETMDGRGTGRVLTSFALPVQES